MQAVASAFDNVHRVIVADDGVFAWPCDATLSDADRVWAGFLGRLADQVRRLGAAMSASAAAYRAADSRSADRLNAAGAGL
ncbi:hypothetical protein GCM10010434_031870 [Winogradskya humida]